MLTGLQIDRGLAINSATGRHASASASASASAKVKYYDTSRAHITQSVEDSLRLMGIEQIDLLLIHRPDPMIDHHETGMTLDDLVASGIISPFSNNCKSLDGESHGIQSSEKPKFEAKNNQATLERNATHPFLLENAKRYEVLAKLVGQEIANRSIKSNIANRAVKGMLVKIVTETNEQRNPTALPVIIGW